MDDINIMEPLYVDYIPKDGTLCSHCKFKEMCPEWYMCATYDRTRAWESSRVEE